MTSQHTTFVVEGPIEATLTTKLGDIIIAAHADAREARVELESNRDLDLSPFTPTFSNGHLVVDLARLDRSWWQRSHRIEVRVTLPADSVVRGNTGSGDLMASGRLGPSHLTTGQGDICITEAQTLVAKTGSGDISAQRVQGAVDLSTGSGDISVRENSSTVRVSGGAGDISLAAVVGEGSINTGAGDVSIGAIHGSVRLNTGSGDISVRELTGGDLTAQTAAGDITVGVCPGIPVWTDITTLTGQVNSTLVGAGHPTDGAAHLEIRATTVSGDISLHEVAQTESAPA